MIQMSIAATKFPVSHPPLTCPWLVIIHGEKQGYPTQTFVDIAQDHCVVANIPEMLNTEICTCSHGWLVLFEFESNECFLLNPISTEKNHASKAATSPFVHHLHSVCTPQLILNESSFFRELKILLRLGESVWNEQYLRSTGGRFRQAAGCGGKIYGRAVDGALLMAKEVGSNLVVTEVGAEESIDEFTTTTFCS